MIIILSGLFKDNNLNIINQNLACPLVIKLKADKSKFNFNYGYRYKNYISTFIYLVVDRSKVNTNFIDTSNRDFYINAKERL